MPLMVKITLLALPFSLITFLVPPAEKTKYFDHLSFNSTLQLINNILSDLQKLLKNFHGKAIDAFVKIPLAVFGAGWATVVSNNLALYLKDLKLLVFTILLLKLVASSLE